MTSAATQTRFLDPFSRISFAVIAALAIAATIAVFRLFPEFDLAVTRLFFEPVACPAGGAERVCGGFPLAAVPAVRFLRQALHYLPAVIAAILLAWTLREWFRTDGERRRWLGGLAALTALLLAPVVIVNGVLKAFSGRPRPYSTDLFGGELPFVPAGKFTDHCAGNCSFVSGEAAGAFWLVCLVPLVPARYRGVALAAALVVAVTASGLRIAFGGHYLSDVLVAALITLLTFSLVAIAIAPLAERRVPGTGRRMPEPSR